MSTTVARRRRTYRRCRAALGAAATALVILLFVPETYVSEPVLLLLVTGVPVLSTLAVQRQFRQRPTRVLLLRPFGEREVSAALTRVVRGHISFVGYTFTFADQHIRPNEGAHRLLDWVARMGGLLTAILAPVELRVESRGTLQVFRRTVAGSWRLAWMWVASRRRLFIVVATERFWTEAAALLMAIADLIVVDASETGSGVVWELEKLRRGDLASKTVFIARQGKLEGARSLVAGLAPAHLELLFGYRPDGTLVREAAFLQAVERCMSRSRSA